MDEEMIRAAALALSARLKFLLDKDMADEIRISRDEALLAQGFADSVADLLAHPSASNGPAKSS